MNHILNKFITDCLDNQTGQSFRQGMNPFGFKTVQEMQINHRLQEQFASGEIRAITEQGKKLQENLCSKKS
jgi:hypothetical protein